VRSDHGTEFQGASSAWCIHFGVRREYSAVYTPEQNGRSELLNRTYIEGARVLLFQRHCPRYYRPCAMKTVSFTRNRLPLTRKPYTPIEYFLRKVPDLSLLRVFGCYARLSIPKKLRGGKLNAVSVSGVFVRYSNNTKGWRAAVSKTVHESPHVIFREHMKGTCNPKKVTFQSDSDSDRRDELAIGGLMHEVPAGENEQPPIPLASEDGVPNADDGSIADTHVDEQGAEPVEPGAVAEEPEGPRRSQRTRHQPDRFVPGTAVAVMGISKPPAIAPDSTEVINTAYMSGYAFAVTGQTVPKNYADIAKFWRLAAVVV
jgi:hypothetical protein